MINFIILLPIFLPSLSVVLVRPRKMAAAAVKTGTRSERAHFQAITIDRLSKKL